MVGQNYLKKNLLLLILIILGIPLIFWDTSISMLDIWSNDRSFTHGYLILPISFYLIFQHHKKINTLKIRNELKVSGIILLILTLWLIANITDINLIQHFSLVLLIWATIWMIFGREIYNIIAFPLFFLFFAVPAGNGLIPLLMDFTANFTVKLIELTGIPIYREGNFFSLPTGNWSVIEACSGVNYLIASLVLGTLYSYLTYTSYIKRTLFITACFIISIIANGIRAFGIVMIGHFSEMKYGTGGDHTFYGWLFYGIVITLLFYLGAKWADYPKNKENITTSYNPANPTKKHSVIIVILLFTFTALLTQLLSIKIKRITSNHQPLAKIIMPNHIDAWQKNNNREINWQPKLNNPDQLVTEHYTFGDSIIQLTIGYYQNQTTNSEAINSLNKLVNNENKYEEWSIISQNDTQFNDYYFKESFLKSNNQKILVWQWFELGQWRSPNPYIAKILNIAQIIFFQENDTSYITLATIASDNRNDTRAQLLSFIKPALKDITQKLSMNKVEQ